VQIENSVERILACPLCKGRLLREGTGYDCASCKRSYSMKDGILEMTSTSTTLGEFSNEQMQEILRAAEAQGWRSALATDVKAKNPAVLDLILNQKRSRFLELLPQPEDGIAVDIGCGYGGISWQLAKKYRQVFSLDSGLERLKFLNVIRKQENVDNLLPIHHANATSLPFADGSVDLVVMVGVFEYLPLAFPEKSIEDVQRRVLAELYRVLKPGGHLYLGTKNRFGWPYWKGDADHNRLRFGPVLPRFVADKLTHCLYDKPYRIIIDSMPTYRQLLRKAGFEDPRFYWPLPGYQFPDAFVPLHKGADSTQPLARESSALGWKRPLIAALQVCGVLKYVVPHFSIVVSKP
jgi:SAM-dependent methyltransferase